MDIGKDEPGNVTSPPKKPKQKKIPPQHEHKKSRCFIVNIVLYTIQL